MLDEGGRLGNGELATARSAQELLEEFCQTGRQAPFEEIVRRYAGMVFHVCLQVTKSRHDAEDATQAVFLTLAVQSKTGKPIKCLGPWLQQVGYRVSLDLRKSSKRRQVREENYGTDYCNNHPEPDGLEKLDVAELRHLISEELNNLPVKYRLPLILHYFGGLSREEIARELKCKVSTLGVRLFRGRELLGSRLAERGVAIGGAVLAVGIADAVHCAVSDSLMQTTCHAATAMAAGYQPSVGLVSANVMSLSRVALKALAFARFKSMAAFLLTASAALAGGVQVVAKVAPIDLKSLLPFNLGGQPVVPVRTSIPSPQVLNTNGMQLKPDPIVLPRNLTTLTPDPLAQPRPLPNSAFSLRLSEPRFTSAPSPAPAPISSTWVLPPVAKSAPTTVSPTLAMGPVGTPPPAPQPTLASFQVAPPAAVIAAPHANTNSPTAKPSSDPDPRNQSPTKWDTQSIASAAASSAEIRLANLWPIDPPANLAKTGNMIPKGESSTPPPKPKSRIATFVLQPLAQTPPPPSQPSSPTAAGTQTTAINITPVILPVAFDSASIHANSFAMVGNSDQVLGRAAADVVAVYMASARLSSAVIADAPSTQQPNIAVYRTNTWEANRSVIRGSGSTSVIESLDANGQVIADGSGHNRTLDFSSVHVITNSIDNPSTGANGWYAQNGGRLDLPTQGPATVMTWGEDPADSTLDLVNSVRLTFKNIAVPDDLKLSLLSPDRNDVPLLPGHQFLAVWAVDGGLDTLHDVALVIRYDKQKALAMGGESSLRLWRYDGSWQPITDLHIDSVSNLISGDASSASYFAVAADTPTMAAVPLSPNVVVPEPATLLTLGAATLLLALRRRRA